tara:strand:+ start:4455 stop:4973 length:519 start_codon:yes stop_codon:yes gene_type:complete
MAFISQGTTFYSFADYDDVVNKDSRLFSANEGLTQDVVEESLIRSTTKILDMLRSSTWWKSYYIRQAGSAATITIGQSIQVPALNPFQVKARQGDFTDLCVYYALSEYLLARVADFGNPDSAERQKLGFYNTKFRELYDELIVSGDWYDFTNNGTITEDEKYPFVNNLVRRR